LTLQKARSLRRKYVDEEKRRTIVAMPGTTRLIEEAASSSAKQQGRRAPAVSVFFGADRKRASPWPERKPGPRETLEILGTLKKPV